MVNDLKTILLERILYPLILLDVLGKIESKTRFQKIMFLAQKEEGIEHGYLFKKYLYGPFSFELNDDLNALEQFDLISVSKSVFIIDNEPVERFSYEITEKGKQFISDKKNKEITNKINRLKRWVSIDLNKLKTYVYSKYM